MPILSCNDNGNATDPQCQCDNWIDRTLSTDPSLARFCKGSGGGACGPDDFKKNTCTCECKNESLQQSATYVGMMPVSFRSSENLGYWYSTPKATECSEDEPVGKTRADGSVCTWKRRPAVRVLRGGDLLDMCWNTSGTDNVSMHVDTAQIRQNSALVEKAFRAQPFQKWSCAEAEEQQQPSFEAIVV